jgi:hypothetical protein
MLIRRVHLRDVGLRTSYMSLKARLRDQYSDQNERVLGASSLFLATQADIGHI